MRIRAMAAPVAASFAAAWMVLAAWSCGGRTVYSSFDACPEGWTCLQGAAGGGLLAPGGSGGSSATGGAGGVSSSGSGAAAGTGGSSSTSSGSSGSGGQGPLACLGCIAQSCPDALGCVQDPTCLQGMVCTVSQCMSGGQPDPICALDCFGGDPQAVLQAIAAIGCVLGTCSGPCAGLLPGI